MLLFFNTTEMVGEKDPTPVLFQAPLSMMKEVDKLSFEWESRAAFIRIALESEIKKRKDAIK